MSEELLKANLFFDEINKIRILEPEVGKHSSEIKNTCKEYVEKIQEFENSVSYTMSILKELAELVEKKKMAAIGVNNLLKTIVKDKESEQTALQSEILEKSKELDNLEVELSSLQLLEVTQQETIDYLTQMR